MICRRKVLDANTSVRLCAAALFQLLEHWKNVVSRVHTGRPTVEQYGLRRYLWNRLQSDVPGIHGVEAEQACHVLVPDDSGTGRGGARPS